MLEGRERHESHLRRNGVLLCVYRDRSGRLIDDSGHLTAILTRESQMRTSERTHLRTGGYLNTIVLRPQLQTQQWDMNTVSSGYFTCGLKGR